MNNGALTTHKGRAMTSGPDAAVIVASTMRQPTRLARLVACQTLLVLLADWLFWNQRIGLSLPVFAGSAALTAFIGLAAMRGPRRLSGGRCITASLILVMGLLPAVEDVSVLSLAFEIAGLALSVEVGASGVAATWCQRLYGAAARLAGGSRQIWGDIALIHKIARQGRCTAPSRRAALLAWAIPIALLTVFLALFALANPIIANWLANLPRPSRPSSSTLMRVAFWTVVMILTWPLVRARPSRPERAGRPRPVTRAPMQATGLAGALLAPAAILRALVVCNLLFAVQLALDGAYLWGGMALPDGVSYAAYAHRGAYPLVATALLSAAFVLVATGRGRRRDGSGSLIRRLALAFTAQNVLLVISSMRRLALYVEAYSLTELRVAAVLWMLLVAVGLALIMLQAVLNRSNSWLISRTAAAAATVLYGCCFLDIPAIVASYNVDHCKEVRGSGPALDREAIVELGPAAIPALDRYLAGREPGAMRDGLAEQRTQWATQVSERVQDWRAWSLRTWRLGRYLDRIVTAPANPGPSDPAAPYPYVHDNP